MKKFLLVAFIILVVAASASAQWWNPSSQTQNAYDKDKVVESLIKNVPVPQIKLGQERKMVAWRAVTFDVENKLGYVYVVCAGVGPIGYYTISGKVASLNSFLVRQTRIVGDGGTQDDYDIDGTTGSNIEGVFFRTTDGTYVELPTTGALSYLYSDKPLPLKVPAFNVVTTVKP